MGFMLCVLHIPSGDGSS